MNYKKMTEEDLVLNFDSYKTIVENSPLYVLKIDKDYRIVYANETFFSDFDYKKDAVLGYNAEEMGMPAESYQKWYMYYDKVFQTGEKQSFETKIEGKQGTQFYKFYLTPVRDDNGVVSSITIYLTNITDTKLIEDERDYIFNFSLDMFAIQTLQGDFLKINPSWNEVLNWSSEKLMGANWLDFIHPEDKIRGRTVQSELLNYNLVVSHETRFQTFDGSYIWLEWNSIPIKNKDIVISVVRNISHWKEIKDRLSESEKRYREVVETANYMLFSTDLKGNMELMNAPGLKISGYSEEELRSLNLLDLVVEEYKEKIKSFYRDMISSNQESNIIEFPIINKTGEIVWLMQSAKLKIVNSEPIKIDFLSKDITVRKDAEVRLRNSEMRLRSVVNSSNEVILVIGELGRLKDANDTAYDELEIVDHELLGRDFREVLADGASVELFDNFLDRNLDISKLDGEFRVSLNNNPPLHFRVKGITYDELGNSNVLLFLTNITEIRHAQKVTEVLFSISRAANLSEELVDLYEYVHIELQKIINAKNFAIAEINQKEGVLEFPYYSDERDEDFSPINLKDVNSITNKVIALRRPIRMSENDFMHSVLDKPELYGSISKSWLGVPLLVNDAIFGVVMVQDYNISDAYTEEDEIILSSISEILASTISKLQYQKELEFLNKDLELRVAERTIQLESTLENLNYENEERKKAQVELQKAQNELKLSLENEKELHEIKSKFISMVSHEYRTPLTVIMSSVNLLKNYLHKMTTEQIDKQYKNISASVVSMTSLLDDVLMIGKTDTFSALNLFEFDLSSSVSSIVENIKFIDNGKHKFEVSMPEELCVVSDKKLLDHAIGNLVSNAVKYSEKGKLVKLVITELDDNRISLEVIDQGIGIPKEDLDQVFESFFRSSNTGTIEGTGLGMSIVKKSVEALGGTIEIDSKVGEGTNIKLILNKRVDN